MESNNLLAVGSTLQWGRYRVERHLASGGFGNTYVVTQVKLNKQRAMKEFFMRGVNAREADGTVSVSNEENAPSFQSQMNKFVREAERLAAFENDHIVRVQDCFDENGTAYYVMDYIDGCSLSELLQKKGRALTEAEVEPILAQVLDALEAVHNHKDADGNGLLHLDLKPGNIMINAEGHVWLIDFGASKQFTSSEAHLTLSSTMMMTPGYAPSEQVNRNAKAIGPWTDFYALGATLYKLLTNATPPPIDDIVDDPEALRLPSSVSSRMADLIRWLMQPSRSKRPQSVAEIRHFIGTFFKSEPPVKAPEAPKPVVDETTIAEKHEVKPVGEETIAEKTTVEAPKKIEEPESAEKEKQKTPVQIKDDSVAQWIVIIVCVIITAVVGLFVFGHSDSSSDASKLPNDETAAQDYGDYVAEENPFDVAYNAFLAIQKNDIEAWKERMADFDEDCMAFYINNGVSEDEIQYLQTCELQMFQDVREHSNLRIDEEKYHALRVRKHEQQENYYNTWLYDNAGRKFISCSYECRFIILDGGEMSGDVIFIHKPYGGWKMTFPFVRPEFPVAEEEVAEDYDTEEVAPPAEEAASFDDEPLPTQKPSLSVDEIPLPVEEVPLPARPSL